MTSAEVNTQQPQQQLEQEGKQARRVMEPMEVGWQFVQEYYSILNREPSRLHRFYSNESFMIHGVEGETVKPCKGQHVSILSLTAGNPRSLQELELCRQQSVDFERRQFVIIERWRDRQRSW